jgi:hypothetical protein
MFDLEGLLPDRLLQGIRTESAEFQNPEDRRLVWREFGSGFIGMRLLTEARGWLNHSEFAGGKR